MLRWLLISFAGYRTNNICFFYMSIFHMFTVSHNNKYPSVGVKVCARGGGGGGGLVCLFIAIFRMFTIWQMSREGVNNMLSFIHTNISNVHCFAYIPLSGYKICALLYSNILNVYCFTYVPESGKTICALLYQYVKCLIFRIYSHVGVDNMCTFIRQYFKCLLLRIYPRVGQNNFRTFT